MTTLSIEIADHDPAETDDVQRIKVTHLVCRERSTADMLTPRSASPGIVVLLPQADSFTLVIDNKPALLVPGLAHVLAGSAAWALSPSSSWENDETGDSSTVIIELNALINGAISLPELLKLPVHLDPVPSEEIERIFNHFIHNRGSLILAPGNPDVIQHLAAAQLVSLLVSAIGIDPLQMTESSWDSDLIKLKTFMVKHLCGNPSVEDMAGHMGMSRSGLYRWAQPLLGASPVQYLRRLRLEKSQELLRNTSLSIEQIAAMTGFTSRYHLGKEFTKHYQTTPARLRREVKQQSGDDPAGKVEDLIRRHYFEEALTVCKTNLKHPVPSGVRNQIQDQKARCLYALGRVNEALRIWERLRDSSLAFAAGKQLCNHYYRCGKHDRATAVLAALFPPATDSQQRELVMIWCRQLAGLIAKRWSAPLPDYLEVRRRYFPNNPRTMSVMADALIGLGQEHRVVEECPDLHDRHLFTLRHAGLYRRGIEENKYREEEDILNTLLLAGQYEEVLTKGADNPELMALALTRLGRVDEAIARYPDHCQEAYLVRQRYQDLLDRWPEPSEYQVRALYALGKTDDLRNYSTAEPWRWRIAQFYLGPDYFFKTVPTGQPQFYQPSLLWKALQLFDAGDRERGRAYLKRIPLVQSEHFWMWVDPSCRDIILTTVTRGLIGNLDLATAELKKVTEKLKYTDWQMVWHDAGFILGNVSVDAYRNQPCQAGLKNRLTLIQALAEDFRGQASVRTYQALLDRLDPLFLLGKPHLKAFVHWRLQVLATVDR